jgi:prefoldin subunit 5|tara:strand:- start:10621 stop:10893 length:273 start_codon:yes stop_codon:yes gene_type:complete
MNKVKKMSDEKKSETKEELKNKVDELNTALTGANEQLQQLSVGFQQAVNRANSLNALASQYEQTINALTARLLEVQAAQQSATEQGETTK